MDILLFLATAAGFTLLPGPNATLIVATSLSHGTRKGIHCACGISTGVAVHLVIALLSTQWVLSVITESVNWMVWMLALTLLYFIVRAIFSRFRTSGSPHLSGAMSYSRGLGISLTNPKGVIFFAAFIPPFIDKSVKYWPQALTLSSMFLLIAICGDILYALFAGKLSQLAHNVTLRKFLKKHKRLAKYRFKGWLSRW